MLTCTMSTECWSTLPAESQEHGALVQGLSLQCQDTGGWCLVAGPQGGSFRYAKLSQAASGCLKDSWSLQRCFHKKTHSPMLCCKRENLCTLVYNLDAHLIPQQSKE